MNNLKSSMQSLWLVSDRFQPVKSFWSNCFFKVGECSELTIPRKIDSIVHNFSDLNLSESLKCSSFSRFLEAEGSPARLFRAICTEDVGAEWATTSKHFLFFALTHTKYTYCSACQVSDLTTKIGIESIFT